MCIHHYFHHIPCGHMVKNLPLSVQHHCADVEKALRFYHDQPSYHPLDEQLCNRYGIPASSQLQTPKTCPEISLSSVSDAEEQQRRIQGYWTWASHVSTELDAYRNAYGHSQAMAIQNELDSYSEITRCNAAHAHAGNTQDWRWTDGPYPTNQMEHIINLGLNQTNSLVQPDYNIVQHNVPWGCGRHNSPQCLIGHNLPEGPFCPYLLASRLPKDTITQEAVCLGALGQERHSRGFNAMDRSSIEKDFMRCAPACLGQDNGLRSIPLSENYIRAIMRTEEIPLSRANASSTSRSRPQGAIAPNMILAAPTEHVPTPNTVPVPPVQPPQRLPSYGMMSPARWYFVASGEIPPPALYNNQSLDLNRQSNQEQQQHSFQEPRPVEQSSDNNLPSSLTRPS